MRRKWSLVGLADDTGVLNIGGRLGSVHGPTYFRRCWQRLSGAHDLNLSLDDAGDWTPGSEATPDSLKESLHRASFFVGAAHRRTGISVVVGGGHDLGYAHLLGIKEALLGVKVPDKRARQMRLGCINLDAHFDLRKPNPKVTSGSPFYLAIESGLIDAKNLVEFGIQRQCNSTALFDYVKEKKIPYVEFDEIKFGKAVSRFKKEFNQLAKKVDVVVISLDLDCLAEAYAPGVSAPQAEGFTSGEILSMLEYAGMQKKCVSLGIFELNPVHDRDEQTSRIAAVGAFRFMSAKMTH